MINGVLLDVGGVISIGSTAIPGAAAAIEALRKADKRIRFVTNITRQSHRNLVTSLNSMGIKASAEEVFTPSVAARDWLTRNGRTPYLLVHPELQEDFLGIPMGAANALVLGDVGEALDYGSLNKAFRILTRGADFLALAQNRAFKDLDGELSLDAGAIVAALEYASRKTAIVLGKPAATFFQMALDSMDCTAHEAVMVGDDAEFDTAPAVQAGLFGLLVRTGKYSQGAENLSAPKPNAVVDDITEAVRWILSP